MVKHILILLLFITTANSFADSIQVYADRNPVGLDESFQLTFKSTDSSVDSPDFSPLKQNFEILNQNQGTKIQIINGQQTSTKQWNLTLMPKRAGNLKIPAIAFGQQHSQASIIRVKEANKTTENTQQSMFLEVEATPETPYVQSQVIYTIRLYYALNLQSGSMSEPSFSGGEIVVKKLGEDRQYQTIRDNKQFSVIERKYALFPQKSGSISIEPINFKAQVIENNGRSSGFDNFFYQPKTHIKRLFSKSIKLEVKPIPNNFQGKNWLPAKNLTLKDSFSQQLPEFKVGEPVTRTLTLAANGLMIGQLPELMNHTNQLKQYTDQPKLDEQMTYNGINSIRQEKIAIIPSKAGEYTLAAIEIPWWNTETDKMEILKLPAHKIKVAEAATIQQPVQAPITQTPTPKITHSVTENTNNDYYKWLTFIFAFAWIVTLIAFFISMKKTNKKTPAKPEKQDNTRTALKKLKQACKNNNAQQAKQAILIWAKANSLAEISQHCAEPLKAEILGLNTFLYGKTGENWQGNKLWDMFNKHQPKKVKEKRGNEDGLEPLYL